MQYRGKWENGYMGEVEWMFYNELAIRRAVRDKKRDYGSPKGKTAGGGGFISDPTATQAIREITPLRFVYVRGRRVEKPETWLKVVDETYKHLPELHKKVVLARYRGENYQMTCAEYNIASTTYNSILTKARMFAAGVAAQYGLVKIVD